MQSALRIADRNLFVVCLNMRVVRIAELTRTRDPPRGNDLDARFKPVEGELKSNLIVPFPCAAVGNKTDG